MEADAAERADNKKRAKAQSDEWKEKAIKSFREEKYEDALNMYTKVNILRLKYTNVLKYT